MNSKLLQVVDDNDWTWAEGLPAEDVRMYKMFMVCKAISNDAEGIPCSTSEGDSQEVKLRPRMSPTPEVDAVWRAHLLRPKSYAALMAVLLKDSEFTLIDYFPEAEDDSETDKAARLRESARVLRMLFGENAAQGPCLAAQVQDAVRRCAAPLQTAQPPGNVYRRAGRIAAAVTGTLFLGYMLRSTSRVFQCVVAIAIVLFTLYRSKQAQKK